MDGRISRFPESKGTRARLRGAVSEPAPGTLIGGIVGTAEAGGVEEEIDLTGQKHSTNRSMAISWRVWAGDLRHSAVEGLG